MAKIIGNPTITFPPEQEAAEKCTEENLRNLKQKVQELKHSINIDEREGKRIYSIEAVDAEIK